VRSCFKPVYRIRSKEQTLRQQQGAQGAPCCCMSLSLREAVPHQRFLAAPKMRPRRGVTENIEGEQSDCFPWGPVQKDRSLSYLMPVLAALHMLLGLSMFLSLPAPASSAGSLHSTQKGHRTILVRKYLSETSTVDDGFSSVDPIAHASACLAKVPPEQIKALAKEIRGNLSALDWATPRQPSTRLSAGCEEGGRTGEWLRGGNDRVTETTGLGGRDCVSRAQIASRVQNSAAGPSLVTGAGATRPCSSAGERDSVSSTTGSGARSAASAQWPGSAAALKMLRASRDGYFPNEACIWLPQARVWKRVKCGAEGGELATGSGEPLWAVTTGKFAQGGSGVGGREGATQGRGDGREPVASKTEPSGCSAWYQKQTARGAGRAAGTGLMAALGSERGGGGQEACDQAGASPTEEEGRQSAEGERSKMGGGEKVRIRRMVPRDIDRMGPINEPCPWTETFPRTYYLTYMQVRCMDFPRT
jgi:hypothetical protein